MEEDISKPAENDFMFEVEEAKGDQSMAPVDQPTPKDFKEAAVDEKAGAPPKEDASAAKP